VETKSAGNVVLSEVSGHSVDDLRLQITQIFALCADTATVIGSIPAGYQPTRFFVTAYLEGDFVHLHSSASLKLTIVHHDWAPVAD